jgi:hypothetical protein
MRESYNKSTVSESVTQDTEALASDWNNKIHDNMDINLDDGNPADDLDSATTGEDI